MRKLIVPALVTGLLGALAATALAATKSITVGDNYFVRRSGVPTVTVNRNDTVKFNFRGDNPHNATVRSGPSKWRSPTKSSGSYSRKLTRRGTYRIYCSIHGASDQSMKLVVK